MNLRNIKNVKVLFILFILLFASCSLFFSFLIPYSSADLDDNDDKKPKKPKKPKKDKDKEGITIEVTFLYEDDSLFGADYPVEGLIVYLYDKDTNTLLITGVTDRNGYCNLTVEGSYTNLEVQYYWDGISQQQDVFEGIMNTIDIACIDILGTFYWDEPGYPLATNQDVDLLYWDGSQWVVMTTELTDEFGNAAFIGLIMGKWSFNPSLMNITVTGTPLIIIDGYFLAPIVLTSLKENKKEGIY